MGDHQEEQSEPIVHHPVASSSSSLPPPPQRVVSLLGAATEILYRLGLGHKLVGRSHECDYPAPAVLALPCISRPRLDVDGSSSREIDDAVRHRSAEGEPIYKLDDEVLSTLVPIDLLIAQDHCRVCAVTPRDVKRGGGACANVKQLVLKPSNLTDCLQNMNDVANAMGVPQRGVALRQTLEHRLDRVKQLVRRQQESSSSKKPRVAVLEWCDPIMGCGYWIPELVDIAGGVALHCPPPGGATPNISFRTLLESKPDVVIFALCGFGLTRAAQEIQSSWSNPSWIRDLQQQTQNQLYLVDGNYLVNRSGPRLVESCEAIAEALHPNSLLGHFGHYGTELLLSLDDAMNLAAAGQLLHTGSRKLRPAPWLEDNDKVVVKNGTTHQYSNGTTTTKKTTTNVTGTRTTTSESPHQVVSSQLRYLKQGDIAKAFALNSRANQDRWCGPERFSDVLRSHADFQRLLPSPTPPQEEEAQPQLLTDSCTVVAPIVGTCEERNGIATVVVTLPMEEEEEEERVAKGDNKTESKKKKEEVRLLWTMITERISEKNHVNNKETATFVWRTEKVGMAH